MVACSERCLDRIYWLHISVKVWIPSDSLMARRARGLPGRPQFNSPFDLNFYFLSSFSYLEGSSYGSQVISVRNFHTARASAAVRRVQPAEVRAARRSDRSGPVQCSEPSDGLRHGQLRVRSDRRLQWRRQVGHGADKLRDRRAGQQRWWEHDQHPAR